MKMHSIHIRCNTIFLKSTEPSYLFQYVKVAMSVSCYVVVFMISISQYVAIMQVATVDYKSEVYIILIYAGATQPILQESSHHFTKEPLLVFSIITFADILSPQALMYNTINDYIHPHFITIPPSPCLHVGLALSLYRYAMEKRFLLIFKLVIQQICSYFIYFIRGLRIIVV